MDKSNAKPQLMKFVLVVLAIIFVQMTTASAESKKVLKHPNLEKRFIVVDTDVELVQTAINELTQSSDNTEKSDSEVKVQDLMQAMKDGPGVGGGGFSYTRGAVKHIASSVQMLLNFLNGISSSEFQLLQSKWQHKFPSRTDLINKILDMHLSTTEQTYAKGLLGLEPLMADFRIVDANTKFVVLQKKLFDTFNNELDAGAQASILRIILHEISHLYNIGLQNDEESFALSSALADRILESDKVNQTNSSKIEVYNNKMKKISFVQVVAAYPMQVNTESSCCSGVEAVTLVELEKNEDDKDPRYAIHAAMTGLQGYDSDQWPVVAQNICNKLAVKLKSKLKWKLERDSRLKSTYGSYCIGTK